MARKRKDHQDNKLPPHVSKKIFYYLKTKDNKTITLGPIDMSMVQLWSKYDGVIAEQKEIMDFNKFWSMHLKSPAFTKLSERSKIDKLKGAKKILPVFIKPEPIRPYMDIRGKQSEVQSNHELSYMSVAFGWGNERGYCKINPCNGVKKFSIANREKYIDDIGYYTIYDEANIVVKVAMGILYLCAARLGDILSLKHNQMLNEGLFIRQGKTGKKQIKQWTDRLRGAINLAIKQFPSNDINSNVLFNLSADTLITKTLIHIGLKPKEKQKES